MKTWIFICGSAEPGADGVGDYCRILAVALYAKGIRVVICAINDKHSRQEIVHEVTPFGSVLRLASALSWEKRFAQLAALLKEHRPVLCSLQYVPYAFNNLGVPWRLVSGLKKLVKYTAVPWHMMMHETWIGFSEISPIKHRIVGLIQKLILLQLVGALRPVTIHTSNVLYQNLLADAGLCAERLPLFSNMQISETELPWIACELAALGMEQAARSDWLVVGQFGSVYPSYPLEAHLAVIRVDAEARGKRLMVLGMGGGVGTGLDWEQRVGQALPSALVRHWGRQSDSRISAFLQQLDLGLVATPRQFVGKSSSAAAFHLHGVPIDIGYEVNIPDFHERWGRGISYTDLFRPVDKIAEELLVLFS